ncbi:hypothetical protein AVEN_204735-1 [Araneus ventricosus]|uniref:Uncharacterized protein n=1 Tax=Araneus ventricosus TaxID=182803 RepID=A0A4Y2H3T2_ARAVE|nr:hypothetical protein AVEN_204735-1 [Araneus ventricosus]
MCRGSKDDSKSHRNAGPEIPSTRATVKRNKEKEQNQQHASVTEIILMTFFTLVKSHMLHKVSKISTRSSHTGFTDAPHGIPNVLKIPGMSRISQAPTEIRAMTSSTESKGISSSYACI